MLVFSLLQEEPITGVREITPKTWQKKAKWKKALTPVNFVGKEEEEEDPLDGLGIKEATEMDDDEFQPNYLEGEETEEDEHGLDDEDWTMNKSGETNLSVLSTFMLQLLYAQDDQLHI